MLNNPELPILVIDDEEIVIKYTVSVLRKGGLTNVESCSDPREALKLLENGRFSLVLLDLIMPWISGKELLKIFREKHPEIPVIVVTSSSDARTAVEAMKLGAVDFMIKRVEENRLINGVQQVLELRELRDEISELQQSIETGTLRHPEAFKQIITADQRMLKQFSRIEITAKGSQTLLISGETGTGKELIAGAIHEISGRDGGLVSVNVAGINDDMFSDTLFGHKKGSFTSADQRRSGLLEKASGGTLFLDEIGDLSHASQVKLLRVLENREYYPIGSDSPSLSSARIITATNKDLRDEVENGSFRKDLYFRLSMNEIKLPPLRERIGDLPLLLEHFIRESCTELSKPEPDFPSGLCRALSRYSFPGNVRELKALVLNAVELQSGESFPAQAILDYLENTPGWADSLPAPDCGSRDTPPLSFGPRLPGLHEAAELLIAEAMSRCGGNQSRAAELLGISQQALSSRLRKSTLQQKL